MSLARLLTHALLAPRMRRLERLRASPRLLQDDLARRLARAHAETRMGREWGLAEVRSADDLRRRIPLRAYELQRPLFERPLYWATTTGTTGGEKRLPVTRDLLRANASGFQLVLASALLDLGTLGPALGKLFFLGAMTPLQAAEDGILAGAGTTIAMRERPWFWRRRAVPGPAAEALPSWEAKMARVVEEAAASDCRIAAGMPPWLLSFAETATRRLAIPDLRKIWPRLALCVTGGTFLEPYRARLEALLGPVSFRNLYSATEGLFAFQDTPGGALLPLTDTVLFEWVRVDDLASERPTRLLTDEVELGVEYALVCSSWAGIFAYPLGDTVRFVERSPWRFVVSGRTKARANVAGEKVTVEEVEGAALEALRTLGLPLVEATLVTVPPTASREGRARHGWLVEAGTQLPPAKELAALEARLAEALDRALAARSKTYATRRDGADAPLAPPRARLLAPGSYGRWQAASGREGAQWKVPRIAAEAPAGLLPEGSGFE